MQERRSSFETWREASLEATADYVEALYGLSSPIRQPTHSNEGVSKGKRTSAPSNHREYSDDTRARLPYLQPMADWHQVARWSLACVTLPLRVLQRVYEIPGNPPRREPPSSVVMSTEGLSVELDQDIPSKRIPFRVTNRGPRRYIDFDLRRFSASDGSFEKGITVSLSAASGKTSALYSDRHKRIASIEFSATESQELILEISAKVVPGLPRSVCGALRMRPEREEPSHLPIQLKLV
jgi:hypothetical protein